MARRVGAGVIVAALAAAMLAFVVQLRRAELNLNDVVAPAATGASSSTSLSITAQSITAAIHATAAVARGPRIDFLRPRPVGDALTPTDRPMIANLTIVDLDRDGLADIIAADAATNRVTWVRQARAGSFAEQTLAEVPGPAHVQAVDLGGDGDLDVVVASLGVLFPNNARIGAIVLLENDGRDAVVREPGRLALREPPAAGAVGRDQCRDRRPRRRPRSRHHHAREPGVGRDLRVRQRSSVPTTTGRIRRRRASCGSRTTGARPSPCTTSRRRPRTWSRWRLAV